MRYLLLAVFAATLAGCSSPSSTQYTSAISIMPTSSSIAHLEAGGLAIRAADDTAVNFDLVPTVRVKNDSSVALHLFAVWEFKGRPALQLIKPNETPSVTSIGDTIDLGIVGPGASVTIDSIPILTFSDSDILNGNLEYILRIETPAGQFLAGVDQSFDSVPFASRWRGIIYTTEASPTPIAVVDGPDDGDWQATTLIAPSCAYPNPAAKIIELPVKILEACDSVRAQVFVTPHHALETIVDGSLPVGAHAISADLSKFSPGLYRVIWTAYKSDTVVSNHGDILVPLQ